VGLGLQFVLDHFASGPGRSHVTSSFGDLVQVFGVRVVGSALWGERWLPDAWRRWHYGLVVVAVASLALVVFACRRAPADRRWFAVAALVFAFVLFAVPVWARGSSPMRMHASHLNVVGARYLVAPVVVLVSGFAVLVDGARRRWLQSLMVVHSVVLIVVSFQLVNPRSDATPWWTLVQEARADCVAKPNTAVVDLRITPSPWTIGIRCERLRDPFVVAG
jgi:hypothetical protein